MILGDFRPGLLNALVGKIYTAYGIVERIRNFRVVKKIDLRLLVDRTTQFVGERTTSKNIVNGFKHTKPVFSCGGRNLKVSCEVGKRDRPTHTLLEEFRVKRKSLEVLDRLQVP